MAEEVVQTEEMHAKSPRRACLDRLGIPFTRIHHRIRPDLPHTLCSILPHATPAI